MQRYLTYKLRHIALRGLMEITWGLPIVGTKTWKRAEKAANFVCIEREKQQDRHFKRNIPLEIPSFCPNCKYSSRLSTGWFSRLFQVLVPTMGKPRTILLTMKKGRLLEIAPAASDLPNLALLALFGLYLILLVKEDDVITAAVSIGSFS